MSRPTFEQARNSIEDAMRSNVSLHVALGDCQASCVTGNWARFEVARQAAIGSLEAYLDHLAAAHRD